ncbi:GAS2 domain protein [Aspergillus clavatus NRRL 1]|uniref:GAS2 domain protein n=1 Tax=Aspergillus clavatus (strain ATCC 1007 / CBS 513.65 / DSM 816 / NCTC 3887 / NRRL 1 / QM 1276 / 107) TaxID=344612 RepID=A1CME6_ASPCL|nr:GAS2 domain protein [Aspergillus clavatus NRRL 1]EAW08733.1 GAS2 domain protein [Aspergillus clavatus NRRL 1]
MATRRDSPIRPSVRFSPTDSHYHPRAISRSPDRSAAPKYHTIDPLLSNLSPESTLLALTSTDAVPKNEKAAHEILWKSISEVSPSERALGIRAAIAAQKLGEWYKEVQAWDWPKRTDAHLGKGFIPPSSPTNTAEEQDYYGSLPSAIIIQHEARIEEIRDGMESLDVDELKEHVLSAHIPARSRPSSSNSTMSVPPPLSYVQLSDFTAVITATILRALPLLSRLNSLLSTWDVRLLVLRQIPGLLRALHRARSELDSAQDMLRSSIPPTEHDALYSRENYHAKRAGLEAMVLSAGRRMDDILDALDGREDSLPEAWIDDLETIESDFSTWVMEAEKRTVENEWLRLKAMKRKADESRREQIPQIRLSNIPEEEDAGSPAPAPSEQPASQSGSPPPLDIIEEGINDDLLDSPSDTIVHGQTSPLAINTKDVARTLPADAPSGPVDGSSAVPEVQEKPCDPQTSESEAELSSTSLEENDLHSECKQSLPGNTPSVLPENSSHQTSKATTPLVSNASILEMHSEPACDTDQQATDPASSESTTEEDVDESPCVPSILTPPSPALDHQFPSNPSELDLPAAQLASNVTDNTSNGDKPAPVSLETDFPGCRDLGADTTPTARIFGTDVSTPIEDEAATLASVIAEAATTEVPASWMSSKREGSPSVRSMTPSPELADPSPSPQKDASIIPTSEQLKEPDTSIPRKTRLESPIKLSKTRPQNLDFDKGNPNLRTRRTSTASVGSLSDYPSLVSSPEIREPRTASSNATPLALETPPWFQGTPQPSGNASPGLDYTLREERLKHLNGQKGSSATSAHNRTLSLPLQRFINERFELQYESSGGADLNTPVSGRRASDASVDLRTQTGQQVPKSQLRNSSTPTNDLKSLASQHLELSHEKKSTLESDDATPRLSKAWEHTKATTLKSSPQPKLTLGRSITSKTADPPKRLIAHPNLDSLGAHKPKSQLKEDSMASKEEGSRSSTPSKQMRRPKKDHLDEKISSILTSIPARIQLVSSDDHEVDDSAVAPSLPLKQRERFRSMTPQGASSRSSTPPPSLTLRPAPSRRRNSQAPEEGSVKLYHLHRGGKAAPTKLFIRTVGENADRVMVRVGGGWADLAEYLREYAIHHGCRTVSETPRVEIQGISSRHSPAGSSPGDILTPTGNSGRRTPSRPASVLSNRPSSSLAVRKIRRTSNVSDAPDFRSSSAGHAFITSYSPLSVVSSRRRLSVCSSASFGGASLASDMHHGSFTNSPSVPLGLAGPTPRSRRVSISPESEAWVEDVLGQARRSSSLRPIKYVLPPHELEQDGTAVPSVPTLSKSRSINDLGKVGSSRRVALRGLGPKS